MSDNNGGSTDYYDIPEGALDLQDLIEHKNMSFSMANIFKACYRFGEKDPDKKLYDLNKIVWFANREINLINKEQPIKYIIKYK